MTLTRRQRDVLAYLQERQEADLDPPTLDELCDAMGTQSRGSMHKHVSALIHEGLVAANDGQRRGVRLAGPAPGHSIPLLGEISAGSPMLSTSVEEYVDVPEKLRSGSAFAIRVRGDSMRDAGILDGDLAIIEPAERVRDGNIVAALIDGQEVTLKELARVDEWIDLKAANPAYPTRRYAAERVVIQGALRGIVREY